MKSHLLLAVTLVLVPAGLRAVAPDPTPFARLPENVPPVVIAWFLTPQEFAPDGYKPILDIIANHSGANVLATSVRAPNCEVTDESVRGRIKEIAAYARRYGIRIAMDLDLRLAREAFQKAYPQELQEMLRLREIDLAESGELTLRIASSDLNDHYTGRTTHYIPLTGRLARAYSYVRGADGIEPRTLQDLTKSDLLTVTAGKNEVVARVRCGPEMKGRKLCVLACFQHFAVDVFAPHLLEFQREIISDYRDSGIVGVCKDEWGFPPCYDGCPAKNDYWFSHWRAEAYAKATGGRDLLRDCLLMTYGERGRPRERQAAINHFMRMSTRRNAEIERDFYETTKKAFGPSAIVATHPTWYPYPGLREFKKNGLDWWQVPRDMAQTDEVTPYCVRTALCKKWNSPLWWNMYYSRNRADYDVEVWSSALAGGRIDYHPVYPRPNGMTFTDAYRSLLQGGLMRADCRIRMLNFITQSPLDCPVAVVFGHACAMNWAGPAYDDVGIAVTDGLWRAGYPADLIPSTEVDTKSLTIDQDGYVRYGAQRYRAVVLYHPEYESPALAGLFQQAAKGKTSLFRVGDWTRDFDANVCDGVKTLPQTMVPFPSATAAVPAIVAKLEQLGIEPQTPATRTLTEFSRHSAAPPTRGRSRLIDGTVVLLSGQDNVSGDPIQTALDVDDHRVTVDAIGIVAVRIGKAAAVEALAAGGLKRFRGPGLDIELPDRVDMAIWRDRDGTWRGAVQGGTLPLPGPLTALTKHWTLLALPAPL
ncbi:MAG: hypothetical protein JXQ73_10605 [Phycisphaerae bacterium]|nr:hypothetical protein [Phycisphaerae bacterium]